MRYAVATLTAVLLVFAGIALAGAGHGWAAGGFGCFALAPVGFLAVVNGLGRTPSSGVAVASLMSGLVVCLGVAAAAMFHGSESLPDYLHATFPTGALVGGLAYIGWLVITALAVVRARRVSRHGT